MPAYGLCRKRIKTEAYLDVPVDELSDGELVLPLPDVPDPVVLPLVDVSDPPVVLPLVDVSDPPVVLPLPVLPEPEVPLPEVPLLSELPDPDAPPLDDDVSEPVIPARSAGRRAAAGWARQ